jgi:hypothetical protein
MKKSIFLGLGIASSLIFSSCCDERTLYCSPGDEVIKSSLPYLAGQTLIYQSESGKKIYVEMTARTGSKGYAYETSCKIMKNDNDACEPSVSIFGKVIDSFNVFGVYERLFFASLTKRQYAEDKEFYSFSAFGNRSSIWFTDNLNENKTAGIDTKFFVLESDFKTPYKQYSQVITYSSEELKKKEKNVFDTNGKLIAFISPNDAEWFYLVE